MVKIPCLEHLTEDQTIWVMSQWEINQIWALNEYLLYASRPPDRNRSYFLNVVGTFYNTYFK